MLPSHPRRAGGPLLPPALRPLARAYLLGYTSAVTPRLLTLLLRLATRRRPRQVQKNTGTIDKDERPFAESAVHILKTGLELQRFPTFCAVLVGGSTLLQVSARHVLFDAVSWTILLTFANHQEPVKRVIDRLAKGLQNSARLR